MPEASLSASASPSNTARSNTGLTHSPSASSRISVASGSNSRLPPLPFTPTKSASLSAITVDDSSNIDFQRFLEQARGAPSSSGAAESSLRKISSSKNHSPQRLAPPTRARKNSTLSTTSTATRRSVSSTIYRNPSSHLLISEAQRPELGLDDTPVPGRSADSRSHLTALGHAAQLQTRANSATFGKGKGKAIQRAYTAPAKQELYTSISLRSSAPSFDSNLASSTSTIGLGHPKLNTTVDTMTKRSADDMHSDQLPVQPAVTLDSQLSPSSSSRSWFGLARAREASTTASASVISPPMDEDEAVFRQNLAADMKADAANTAAAPTTVPSDMRSSWLPWRQYSSQIQETPQPDATTASQTTEVSQTEATDVDKAQSTSSMLQEPRPTLSQRNSDTDTIKYRTVLKRGWMGARYEVQEPVARVQELLESAKLPAAVELKPETSPTKVASSSSNNTSSPQLSTGEARSTSGAWIWRAWGAPSRTTSLFDSSTSVDMNIPAAKAPSTHSDANEPNPVEGATHIPQSGESWTYSSYVASWVPTWVYNAQQEASPETIMAETTDDGPSTPPRTPAEQVKADALARDTPLEPSKAILNDKTRSSWIQFFASRSANLPKAVPGLIKDVDGMEVMDISDMDEAIGPGKAQAKPKQIAGPNGAKSGTLAPGSQSNSRASSVEEGTKLKTPLLSTSKESVKMLGKAALTKAANVTAASGLNIGKGKRQDAKSASSTSNSLAVEERKPRSGASTPTRSLAESSSFNLVLPSFEDGFGRAPRMWAPKVSMLERTLSAVNSYLFSRVPDVERMNRPTRNSTYGSDVAATGTTSRSKRPGQHLAGKSKVSGLGSSKDKGVEQALKEVAELSQRLPRAWSTVGMQEKAQTKGTLGISKIVVIGVHGWFTQSIFKTMIGEATGTSSKFAAMQAESVRRHFAEAGLELNPEAITVISLQGDGKVADRVDRLFSEMISRPKWVQDMKEADALFLSAHSQGAIVATQLLARLIEQKHIQAERTRICLLAMCGIHHGPFAHLKSSVTTSYINYFETAAAKELFEFQSSSTIVSQQHTAALKIILDAGAKCVNVGSTDDNVVPIYSALNSGNNHPSILRALYIDGQAFPKIDFLTNLLVMCVAVRNAGLNDYNLLTLLSASVAGSLYGGTGHSNVYEERAVYDLATRYLFEVTHPLNEPTLVPGTGVSTQLDGESKRAPTLASEPFEAQRWNPYELPWSLRGLFEDKLVRSLFAQDILDLLNSYEEWKPDPKSKALKDLQWRLAPMRSIARPPIQEVTDDAESAAKTNSSNAKL